jgi:hypothetical protein
MKKKRAIIIIAVIVLAVCILAMANQIFFKQTVYRVEITKEEAPIEEPVYIELRPTLIGNSGYNPAVFYEMENYVFGSPVTFWEYVASAESMKYQSESASFSVPIGVDVETSEYIISFDRRILEMWIDEKFFNGHILSVAFEEEHQGNKAFFYQIDADGLSIRASRLDSPTYIMQGEERVYICSNVRDMNQVASGGVWEGK